jgi:hypothetical protein
MGQHVKIMIVKNVFDMFYVFSLCFLFKNIFVMFLNDSTGYKNRSPTGPGGQILGHTQAYCCELVARSA